RRERRDALASGLMITTMTGKEITLAHWDAFWIFYQDTGSRKWGHPYLTRAFFSEIAQTMPEQIMMVLAQRDGAPIAGALNFIAHDTLFGRYWGCTEHHPFLHFEVCYYRAIDFAIARGLARVEAGAQGEHKIARGYEPVKTASAHWIAHPQFRDAIARYLEQERRSVSGDVEYLEDFTPFKNG
ncbi:MAG: GNAT family N-acetyltransferase, partial [Parvularculaceae bacterium]